MVDPRSIRISFLALLLPIAGCDCSGTGLPTRRCETVLDCASGEVCLDNVCQVPGGRDAGRDVEPGCDDIDGDGWGPGCSVGDDCAPEDPTQWGREICDGMDNDCDGVADNGVLSECGDCDPDCHEGGLGGDDDPFDPDMDESDGVGVDDDGALILDSRRVNTNFIWIANTGEGTVSEHGTTHLHCRTSARAQAGKHGPGYCCFGSRASSFSFAVRYAFRSEIRFQYASSSGRWSMVLNCMPQPICEPK